MTFQFGYIWTDETDRLNKPLGGDPKLPSPIRNEPVLRQINGCWDWLNHFRLAA
jgi:hypothetical protein